jgi:hypothetical protein
MARFFFKHSKCPNGWRASVFALEVEPVTRRMWSDHMGGWYDSEEQAKTQARAVELSREVPCPACGKAWSQDYYSGPRPTLMGRVNARNRLMVTGLECPCDGRCTGAVGPNCDCSCGGANHGSHRLITVNKDAGAVPSCKGH